VAQVARHRMRVVVVAQVAQQQVLQEQQELLN
jgi:hypothetical protein